jgi:hypothetical protein
MVQGLDLSPEQVELSLVEVRRRLSSKENPVWVSASVCYAQKPALEASTCYERQLSGVSEEPTLGLSPSFELPELLEFLDCPWQECHRKGRYGFTGRTKIAEIRSVGPTNYSNARRMSLDILNRRTTRYTSTVRSANASVKGSTDSPGRTTWSSTYESTIGRRFRRGVGTFENSEHTDTKFPVSVRPKTAVAGQQLIRPPSAQTASSAEQTT